MSGFLTSFFFFFSNSHFFCRNLVLRPKTALGPQNRVRFETGIFGIFLDVHKLREFRRAGMPNFGSDSWSLLKMAWRLWCRGFFLAVLQGFFVSVPFSRMLLGPLHTPTFLFWCFFRFVTFVFGLRALEILRFLATQQRSPSPVFVGVGGVCVCVCVCVFFFQFWLDSVFFSAPQQLNPFRSCLVFWGGGVFFWGCKRHPRKNTTKYH